MTSGGTDGGAVDQGSDGPSALGGLVSQLRRGLRVDPPPCPPPPPADPSPDTAPAHVPGPARPFPPQVRSAVRRLLESAGLAPAEDPVAVAVVDPAGRHHPVGPDGLVIGRAHASLGAVDISVDHPAVSRRHAVVTLEGKMAVVTDAGSTNGTSITRGGSTLPVGRVPVPLEPGDRLLAGGDVVLCEVAVRVSAP